MTTKKRTIPKECSCYSHDDDTIETIENRTYEKVEKENHVKRNRKQMAWISLFSCLVVVLLMMFVVEESRLGLLGDVMTWFFLIMGSIVGTYIGFSSFGVDGKGSFTRKMR